MVKSEVDHIFSHVLKSIRLFGAEPKEISSRWNIIPLVLVQLRAVAMIANFFYYIIGDWSLQNLSLHVLDVFVVTVAAYSLVHFRNESQGLLSSFNNLRSYLDPAGVKRLRRWSTSFTILGWTHAVLMIIMLEWSLLDSAEKHVSRYLKTYLFDLHLSPGPGMVVICFDWMILACLYSLPIFFMMFYALSCRFLADHFYSLEKMVHTDVRGTGRLYLDVYNIVEKVERIFSGPVFCWCFLTVMVSSMVIYDMAITSLTDSRDASYHFYVPPAMYSAFGFVAISMASDSVTAAGKAVVPILLLKPTESTRDHWTSRILITLMIGRPPCMTAAGVFVLSRTLILTVVSLMATYVIIVLQLTAPEKAVHHHHSNWLFRNGSSGNDSLPFG